MFVVVVPLCQSLILQLVYLKHIFDVITDVLGLKSALYFTVQKLWFFCYIFISLDFQFLW